MMRVGATAAGSRNTTTSPLTLDDMDHVGALSNRFAVLPLARGMEHANHI